MFCPSLSYQTYPFILVAPDARRQCRRSAPSKLSVARRQCRRSTTQKDLRSIRADARRQCRRYERSPSRRRSRRSIQTSCLTTSWTSQEGWKKLVFDLCSDSRLIRGKSKLEMTQFGAYAWVFGDQPVSRQKLQPTPKPRRRRSRQKLPKPRRRRRRETQEPKNETSSRELSLAVRHAGTVIGI